MRCQVSTFGVARTCATMASAGPEPGLPIGLGTVGSLDGRIELVNRESNHQTIGLHVAVRLPLGPTPS